jgi:ADP-heptose:LPS heptosyltransferase
MEFLNIVQEGGIGDLIITAPLIQHYFNFPEYRINLYTQFPSIAKIFLPFVNTFPPIHNVRRDKNDFDFMVSITDMVYFSKKSLYNISENIRQMYESFEQKKEEWKAILERHPFSANEMAHKALSIEQKRWTLPFYFVGKEYKKYEFYDEIKDVEYPQKYITIHDGFDASCYYKFMRSTKSWSIESWEKFIQLFKQKYPDINVVQLGGVKHNKIKGVDVNFAGQLDFKTSLRFLKSSLLHIDGDSGLVHARHLLNKKSLVIFGSTNVNYFGYPENTNLAPKFCGDCWWKNSDWMQNCKEGYNSPKCIDSILPLDVLNAIEL